MKERKGDFSYAPETVKYEWDELMLDISEASKKVEKEKWSHFTPQFLDTHSATADVDRAVKTQVETRQLYREQKISQLEANVRIKSEMPVTIFPIGDIHWGSVYSNHELWDKHRETIMETPGAYVVFLHNLVDNGIKWSVTNAISNGVPPWEQFRVMQKWIKELDQEGKVLGGIFSDCHEGWSWNTAGVEAEKLLYGYEGRNFPVIENGGILHLDVGKGRRDIKNKRRQEYSIGLWHKQGPFNSRFNPEHALRQNRRLNHESITDAEMGAHYHVTCASVSYEGAKGRAKPVAFMRVGTYKGVPTENEREFITDKWAVEKFGTSGEKPGTALHTWVKTKRLDTSHDFDTAIEKHLAIRTYALVEEMGLGEKFRKLMK